MSLLHPLATFQTGVYAVSRPAVGTRVDGIWTEGAPTTFDDVPMMVTPPTGKALNTIPEGATVNDVRSIRCEFDLRNRDSVTIDGETFCVYLARRWTVRSISYTYANAVRERLGV